MILACLDCDAALPEGRRKFCSDGCRARHASQKWRDRQPGRLATCQRCGAQWRYKSGGGLVRPLCPACEATHRRCYLCRETRLHEDFFADPRTREGLSSRCRTCSVPHARKYVRPERRRDSRLRATYGISEDEFERRATEQHGRCAICKREPKKLFVDHCHSTNRVRKLLCGNCNVALGMLREDPAVIRRAAAYVESYMTEG